jgi:AcrR family transcriptional regulator
MAGIRSKDHDAKRRLILESAANLFAARGFTATSVAQISAACNASKAWIYHYFPAKEDILFALLQDFVDEVRDRLTNAAKQDLPPEASLRLFIEEALNVYAQYRINYPVLFNEMVFLPLEQQEQLKAIENEPVDALEAILTRLNPAIASLTDLKRSLTYIAFGTINATSNWYNPAGSIRIDTLTDMIYATVLAGVLAVRPDKHPWNA